MGLARGIPPAWIVLGAVLLAAGCGDDDDVVPDSGAADAGEDGGAADAGEDGGAADAGEDGGAADAGEDGGAADAGEDGGSSGVHPAGWSAPTVHGAAFNGDGVAACTDCHGTALEGGSSEVSCETCHSGFQTDCTFCHGGTDNASGAPPEGVDGELARDVLEVGAHTEHVAATELHDGMDCTACHGAPLPDSALTDGHVDGDGAAEVVFGELNPDATYDTTTGTCSSVYCHGDAAGSNGQAVWDQDVALGCGDCHSDAPTTGRHPLHLGLGLGCDSCHSATVDGSNAIVGPALHVNGTRDVVMSGGGTWDPATGSCAPSCHGTEDW